MKLEQALAKHSVNTNWIILNAWRGSVAHGTWVPKEDPNSIDDKDTMGVVVPGVSHYLGMDQYGSRGTQEIKEGEWDIVFYEARKVIGLLENGNPNVLSLLWLPRNLYISKKQAGELLIENRNLFVGSHVFHSFAGYANSQLHKMTHFPDVKQAYMGQKRAELVEQFGYDTKNAAHLIRLLRMCIEFLKDGELIVDRGGLDATQLLDIKRGDWPIEKVQEESERLFRRAEDAYDRSTLPSRPDHDKIKELAIDVVRFELKERQEL